MTTNHFTISNLTQIAKQSMLEKNLLPDYSPQAMQEAESINRPAQPEAITKDLRGMLWCSIDNDDSKDLDQLTFAEQLSEGYKIYIAVADVASIVKPDMAINEHAEQNTTTVYTPTKNFAMIPEKLSTDLTSLNPQTDRLAVVTEVNVGFDGTIHHFDVYSAMVHNYAQLAYNSVSGWLNNTGPIPDRIKNVPGLDKQLLLQDKIAQTLRKKRYADGSLDLQTIESYVVIENDRIVRIGESKSDRANQLIEHFMISANSAATEFLMRHNSPVLRRIVRVPKYWNKIVDKAAEYGVGLPVEPNSKALEQFLVKQKEKDPLHFPDLSLTIIKLLGRGEYYPQFPGKDAPGHFGLNTKHYSHTTAPNRRYPDVINQRLIKAVLHQQSVPYTDKELIALGQHCSEKEEDADRVARKMTKCAAAVYLQDFIGHTYEGIITGASEKGTWVRIFNPPVEGKVVKDANNADVGDRVKVKLLSVDVLNGYIDFQRLETIKFNLSK
jgi:exoribonuclease-2